jgi:hypothetical protein
MTCPDCDREIYSDKCQCGYRVNRIVLTQPQEPQQNGVGRDEFGDLLYHAVRAIGEIKQLRVLRGRVAMGELPDAGYQQKEAGLIQELAQTISKLKADEVVGITTKYPWVAGL